MDTPTIADQVSLIRHHESALRNMRRNQGRTMATVGAVNRRTDLIGRAQDVLLNAGQQYLVGELVEEAKLAERLRVAHAAGQKRVDLDSRLRSTRLRIRQYLAVNGELPIPMAGVLAS